MENWAPTVVYQLAIDRHSEEVARGTAAQHLKQVLGAPSTRTRLAKALVSLAARLDAAASLAGEAPAPRVSAA